MTYEFALELKNAGFPQARKGMILDRTINSGKQHGHEGDINSYEYQKLKNECFIPSLSELIEACGDKITLLEFKVNGVVAKGVIFHGLKYADELYTNENMQPNEYFLTTGSTPEEAVAKLWLALNKK